MAEFYPIRRDGDFDPVESRPWIEQTYGSRWMNSPSPQRHQIWRMECLRCEFKLEPSTFRHYDEFRADHPEPYGNFASISHARKLMREHVEKEHKGKS